MVKIYKRVRPNTSSTSTKSEVIENNELQEVLREGYSNKYDIPYIEDKEAKIGGTVVPTNLLDSIAKYAGLAGVDLDEAEALAKHETNWARVLMHNYVDPDDKVKRTKELAKEINKTMANANFFKSFGKVPAANAVRDFAYYKQNRKNGKVYTPSKSGEPPLLHALNYYKSGKYNPGEGTGVHTTKVQEAAQRLRQDSNYMKWRNTSGVREYSGQAQKERDKARAEAIEKFKRLAPLPELFNKPKSKSLIIKR